MSFEDELAARMRDAVDGVSAPGNLGEVEARSARAHRRRQSLLAGGVAVLVVGAVGSLVLVGTRDGGSSGPSVATVAPVPVESVIATVPGSTATTPNTEAPVPDVPMTSAVGSTGVDRADQYLVGSSEIYRRTLPDGSVFVARLSEETYASVFGIEWRAPTGSAAECLGDRALFTGVPDTMGYWGSAWIATRWFDGVDLSQPAVVAAMTAGSDPMIESTSADAGHFLIRTGPEVRQVVVIAADGSETDRADVVDGLAMVRAPLSWTTLGSPPRLSAVGADGQESEPVPFDHQRAYVAPAECGPGEPPARPLPAAGIQPENAASAEAQIRERHALLVDQSISRDDKPDDLLDDRTGVDVAVEQAQGGQYAQSVAGARYTIDEVVFTDPDTAWFRYSITAPTGTFDRFGTATFNGRVWQITRQTLCGDLALAGGTCVPRTAAVEPPVSAEWEESYRAWTERASLYNAGDGCSPLSQC